MQNILQKEQYLLIIFNFVFKTIVNTFLVYNKIYKLNNDIFQIKKNKN
jgi:hypothetical protein